MNKTITPSEARQVAVARREKSAPEFGRNRFLLLAEALERLTAADTCVAILDIIRTYARHLAGAAGASIVMRNEDSCYYVEEDSPSGALWKGRKFPLLSCISGWSMLHRQTAVIADVFADERIPREAYEPTFVKSLVMVPVGGGEPFAAIGAYWAERHEADAEEVAALETLARASATAWERQAAQQRLRCSEQLYRSIAELSPDGILVIVNERFVYANAAALAHLRAERPEQVIGRSLFDFILPQFHDRARKRMARVQSGMSNPLVEATWRRLDGRTLDAEVAAGPVLWEGKTAIQALIRDVGDRRRIQDALAESEERFRALVEGTAQAVWETDAQGRVTVDSPSWRRYTGQTREEMLGYGWLNAIHREDRPNAEKRWRDIVAQGEAVNTEFRLRRAGGDWCWNNLRAAPLFNGDGSIRKWVAMSIDISARKDAEEKLRRSEEFHRITVEAGRIGTWDMDLESRTKQASSRMLDMLGLPPGSGPIALSVWENVIVPEDQARFRAAIEEAASKGRPFEIETRVRGKNGELRWLHSRGERFRDPAGGPLHLHGATIDITEQKCVQEELRIASERLQLAIEGTGDGLWDFDLKAGVTQLSARFKEILGYKDDEFPDRHEGWPGQLHPDDQQRADSAMQDCLEGRTPSFVCEYRMKGKDGRWRWVLSRGVLVARDSKGRPLRMTGMITDISERKQADERVWQHANFDALTGMPNRRLFRDRLDQEVKRAHRGRHSMALLFIDLDRFKEVNDLLGHDAGDLLLIQAARRIKSCVRAADTVARLGGDEFTIILAELDGPEQVEQVAQKVLDALTRPFSIGSESAYVSGSIGITLYPEDATTPEELIRKADQAMYAAKHAGKNQFSYFTHSMDRNAHLRLRLINELRSALHAGQLSVRYQPVVELASGRIVKAEALLRWTHPRFGAVEPSRFIPLAEESGMINEIGDWVFREAACCAKRWSERLGTGFQIGVNKSPIQFLAQEKDDWLDYLERLQLPASSISVEITEGMLLHASANVCSKLLAYRDAGIQVAIDDFGTGYSSMAYLKKFDIDYLKIDQSFVRDMAVDAGNRAIAESIIVMAHKLGLKVIAEGVETAEQKALLLAAGCDYGQGYLFSQPLEMEAFERLLTAAAVPEVEQLH